MSTRRLFVALPLPDHIREALLDPMEGISAARWQDADNLHITLRFIGEADRHLASDVITALEQLPFEPFQVRIEGVGHFEGKSRAKAIWARVVRSAAMDDLHTRVEMACRRAGLPAETRKFIPHITLARLNSGSGDIANWLARNGSLHLPGWTADRFALFESDLTPNGAIYQEIASFPER